jgi:hypothetical protein
MNVFYNQHCSVNFAMFMCNQHKNQMCWVFDPQQHDALSDTMIRTLTHFLMHFLFTRDF